jgi:hypothetical protein
MTSLRATRDETIHCRELRLSLSWLGDVTARWLVVRSRRLRPQVQRQPQIAGLVAGETPSQEMNRSRFRTIQAGPKDLPVLRRQS